MEQSPEFQRLLRARGPKAGGAKRLLPGEVARGLDVPARPGDRVRRRPRWRISWSEARLVLLGGMAAGLAWAMLPGWTAADDAGPVTRVDPWAESKRSQAILQPQGAAPTSLVTENGRLIRAGNTAGAVTASASFGTCHSGGGTNCVVDGDTFWMAGEKIRIADIDIPETHPPRCAEEARLGAAATARLHALLNAGPVTLERIDRDTDRYGRKLRVVTRGGQSLGGVLVGEGLARWYGDGQRSWCG